MFKFMKSLLVSTVLASMGFMGSISLAAEAGSPLDDLASEKAPTEFATADEVVANFKSAVTAGDADKLAELLGLDAAKAKATENAKETFELIQLGVKNHVELRDEDDAKIVVIGDRMWPFPFPISKKDDGKWSFDTYAGLEEIVARRVGENELFAIDTLGEYVDAQMAYAAEDRDGDRVLEYAQKLMSTKGMKDGLFWETEKGDADEESPGGAALSAADYAKAKRGEGYFGYRYRVLTSQGENIAGGKFDYIINGNMIAGFAAVAWPVKYGETGVHTFVVNKEGIVYQADLGENTDKLARDIRTFNPGDKWEIAD
ncbi:DUF2950 family protein [Rhizobium sp. KVB221]|uniref:DUF2950 family protein n=1 Tax=Rhizobium setariae TaxID=2801340 RepID=A0A936YPW6_9HYPH|nr:DUF2950 family protein [Rhizobium setariae]MBL0372296.1 DUF2950 family protein [Rhizobium setariae]